MEHKKEQTKKEDIFGPVKSKPPSSGTNQTKFKTSLLKTKVYLLYQTASVHFLRLFFNTDN